jgi:HAD superfamily hydrolase (TIGR01459 family)
MHSPTLKLSSATLWQPAGLREMAGNFDVILCDVWGVIHNGVRPFAAAIDALTRFRAGGGSVVLITNAPRPGAKVVEFLDGLGVSRAAYDGIVSSGDVTISLILARGDTAFAHIGPMQDHSLFTAAEDRSGKPTRRVSLAQADYVVCTGLDDADRETPADYADRLAEMRRRELEFICANPDIVVEVGDRLVYCAGALAEAYAQIGGRVIQAGKPFPPIYARALGLVETLKGKPVERRRVLAVGDAMHTDVKGAGSEGLASLFVTSGIHRAELHKGRDAAALEAAAFRQFFEDAGFAPSAAIAHLVW